MGIYVFYFFKNEQKLFVIHKVGRQFTEPSHRMRIYTYIYICIGEYAEVLDERSTEEEKKWLNKSINILDST